jgi:hypothetical protein
MEERAIGGIPNLEYPGIPIGEQPCALAIEGHGVDKIGMPSQRPLDPPAEDVVEVDRPIGPPRGDGAPRRMNGK